MVEKAGIEGIVARIEETNCRSPERWSQFPGAMHELLSDVQNDLLRLQEERDKALQQRDYENEERRTSVALLDEAYRQNCALLEALKKARGKLIDASTHSGDEARRMVNDAESIMWSAIDDVEGKE